MIPGRINRVQILIGVLGLALGSLVYIVDRPPDQTYFVIKSGIDISLFNTFPNLFGPLGNSLPTFIHVFSFILVTAGLISCQKRVCLVICLSWFLFDCAFELGQKLRTWPLELIPNSFVEIPFLESVENYFLCGTFDHFDLAVIAMGAATAYFVLVTTYVSWTSLFLYQHRIISPLAKRTPVACWAGVFWEEEII